VFCVWWRGFGVVDNSPPAIKNIWQHGATSALPPDSHLIEEAHSSGPMNKITETVHCHNKGPYLNTIERFHIHTESAKNNHLNDPQTIHPSAIFDTILKTDH